MQVHKPVPFIWGGFGRLIRQGFTVREIERLLKVKAVHREKGRHMRDEELRAL